MRSNFRCNCGCGHQNNSNSECEHHEHHIEESCKNICCMMQNNNDCCSCGFDDEDNRFPSNPMYGQSYVPLQKMSETFTPEVGLKMGTIFPELVSPYMPNQSIEDIEYIRANNHIGEGCNR